MLELFETIRVDFNNAGYQIDLKPHLTRLELSLSSLGHHDAMAVSSEISQELNHYLKSQNKSGLHKLKISLTLDINHQLIKAARFSLEPYTRFQDPSHILQLKILDPKRYHSVSSDPLVKLKTNRREDFSLELKNYDEVIWLNERGEIAEGSYTNIFWQDLDGGWHTPSLAAGILAGTMRAKILATNAPIIANEARQPIIEGLYPVSALKNTKRIVVTNAMLGPREATLKF